MAEGNANRPAPETLTTEDVDRLSERFKPSWETEPQNAPQPARPALKHTMLGGGTAPAAPLAPPGAAPAAPVSPPPGAAPAAAPVAAKPMATVSVGKEGIETAKPVMRHPTLVGIAPQAIRQVSGAPQAAPDDLDWELPAGERPEPPSDMAQTARIVKAPEAAPKAEASRIQQVQPEPPKGAPVVAAPPVAPAATPSRTDADEPMAIDVEELPPKSQPSGIGEKYVPRDANAPAVVLNDEVARTEAQARANVEAQHRARSALTIAKMPAVRVPGQAPVTDFVDEDTVSHRRKGGRGVWVVLALLTLGGGTAAAVALLRKPELPAPVTTATAEKPVIADTQAPPPPAVTTEPPPPAPVAAAESEGSAPPASATEPPPKPAKGAAVAPPVEPAAETPKRPPAPAARPSTKPKPTSTGKATTGSASRPSRPSVIVRDNPF
jgi:hypothetical protein